MYVSGVDDASGAANQDALGVCAFPNQSKKSCSFIHVPTTSISTPPILRLKLWIIKLAQQPPMYTASLARMFVGTMPMGILMHMALAVYMLGNSDILDIGFVR